MKKIISALLALLMIVSSMTILTSCGTPKDDGAEISIYLGDKVFDFDPSDYYVSTNAEQILSLLYEPLFRLSENGNLKKAAADSYDIDEDEHKITIELKESYWSDKIQLKASDFVYAWCERIINPAMANPAAALFLDIVGVKEVMAGEGTTADIGIKATEMMRIDIEYCDDADPKEILKNLASIATAPVREDIVEASPSYWSKTVNTITTNGPFKMKTYSKINGEFELTRNVGYHQSPEKKDYDNVVNPGLLYSTFRMSDEDVEVSYEDIENKVTFIMTDAPLSVRKDYSKKAEVVDHTSTYTYVFNTKNPLFADKNVRLALSAAIDRNEIVKAITFGKAADGFIPDASFGSEKSFISASANMDKAREYLSKADSAVVAANKSFTVFIDTDEQSAKIAELVCAAWNELGFDVTYKALEPVETEILQEGFNPGKTDVITEVVTTIQDSGIQALVADIANGKTTDFDVIAIDWQMYSTYAAAGLSSLTSDMHGCGVDFIRGDVENGVADSVNKRTNITGWSSTEYDALVEAVRTAEKKKDKKAAVEAAEEYLMSEMPVCPIIFNQNFYFKSSKISKIKIDGFGNFVFTDVKLGSYKKYLKPEEE